MDVHHYIAMGIDQSLTSTGVVVTFPNGEYYHEVIRTTANKEDPLDNYRRCITIANRIADIALSNGVDFVNIEGLGFASTGNATRDLAGLQFLIIDRLMNGKDGPTAHQIVHKINVVTPTSLKKDATGNGRAKKEEMFENLPRHVQQDFEAYGKTRGRYDLADAWHLAHY